jgi:hypothetical protein
MKFFVCVSARAFTGMSDLTGSLETSQACLCLPFCLATAFFLHLPKLFESNVEEERNGREEKQ